MNNKIYKRNILYRTRKINNKNILLGNNQCFELNELASVIWNNLNDDNTVDDLVRIIYKEYDSDKETIINDVNNFISEMVKSNAILESE